MSPSSPTTHAGPASDPTRLRLIVRAFLDCRQEPTLRAVSRQFRYETGRTAEVEEVERAVEAVCAERG